MTVADLLPFAWSALVFAGAGRAARRWRLWRPPARLPGEQDGPTGARSAPVTASGFIGGLLLRVAGRHEISAGSATRLGRAVLAMLVTGAVMAPAAPAVGGLVWALPAFGARRRRRLRRADMLRHLPEVTDLLLLAIGAGLTVPLAVAAVARRASGPLADELGRVVAEAGLGRRFSDALAEVPQRVGEEVRPLTAALVASDRYGAPLLAGLERLSGELRSDRRRRAEDAARRIPVKLLFPLVFCTLPAFALLTVAPLLAGALGSLRL